MSIIDIKVLDNGDLELSVSASDRDELREIAERQPDVAALCELLESYWTNGSYQPFDAGDGNPFVGLSSAPCIAEAICYPHGDSDDADNQLVMEIDGRFWYFSNYMIESPLETLAETGKVTFALGS